VAHSRNTKTRNHRTGFTKLRKFGCITIRVNAKNGRTPPPKIIKVYANGDMRGIRKYVQFSNRFRNLGFYEGKGGLLTCERKIKIVS
jgi:hypothetical protein